MMGSAKLDPFTARVHGHIKARMNKKDGAAAPVETPDADAAAVVETSAPVKTSFFRSPAGVVLIGAAILGGAYFLLKRGAHA